MCRAGPCVQAQRGHCPHSPHLPRRAHQQVSHPTLNTLPAPLRSCGPASDSPRGRWPKLTNRDWEPPFAFLLAADGRWRGSRKNFQLGLDAFVREFAGNPDYHLILKVTETDADVNAVVRSLPSNVEVFTGRLEHR